MTDPEHDLVIRGGVVVDGTGSPGQPADVLVRGAQIVWVAEDVDASPDARVLDASGCVVTPGFVNVLSHAYVSLQLDPRGLSDLYQGVTTEIFGEGLSLGPVVGQMTEEMLGAGVREPGVNLAWPTLSGFLSHLADTGVGLNVASLVGAANLRMSVAGLAARPLTPAELDQACELLDHQMHEGALGVGAALIYPPGTYADFTELAAYCSVVARHDGVYAAHLRSEGDRLLEGVEETIELARQTGVRAEVFHLKALGKDNWAKLPRAIELIEDARRDGLEITADIYPYAAGATGLAASIPPAFLEDGVEGLRMTLSTPSGRARVRQQWADGVEGWEDLWELAGGPAGVVILTPVPEHEIPAGGRLANIAASRHLDPLELLLDVLHARPNTDAAYFMADEENAKLAFQRPWVCVGSDSEAAAISDQFDPNATHPRAFGAFARVLASYVGPRAPVTLEEGIRKMTSLPASTFRLSGRGVIRPGHYADLAIFDPATVLDTATYATPASYATGMRHVLVNGVAALLDGQPTSLHAGQALRRGLN